MKKNLWMVAALVMGMAMSVTLTSCGDDEEPTPTQQNNGNGGNEQGTDKSGEINGHKYVDLGLPSGTLWAECNVGASKPEEYGLFFAWGETTGYTRDTGDGRKFDWPSYKYNNGSENNLTKYCNDSSRGYNGFTDYLFELLPEDDAATANWGTNWCMPSSVQISELFNPEYTTVTWTTRNWKSGRLITSKMPGYTDKSIFLPAAGYRNGSSLDDFAATWGTYGRYWSRTLNKEYSCGARAYYFSSSQKGWDEYNRHYGKSVRPVRK